MQHFCNIVYQDIIIIFGSNRLSAYSDLVCGEVVLTDHLFAGALEGVDGVAVSCHLSLKSLVLLDLTLNH